MFNRQNFRLRVGHKSVVESFSNIDRNMNNFKDLNSRQENLKNRSPIFSRSNKFTLSGQTERPVLFLCSFALQNRFAVY